MNVVKELLSGNPSVLENTFLDKIIKDTEEYFPDHNSKGKFTINVSGYEDGSPENGNVTFNVDVDSELLHGDLTDSGFKTANILDGIKSQASMIDGTPPSWNEEIFKIKSYNGNNVEDDLYGILEIVKYLTNNLKTATSFDLLNKVSVIYSIASFRMKDLTYNGLNAFNDGLSS